MGGLNAFKRELTEADGTAIVVLFADRLSDGLGETGLGISRHRVRSIA
jgi:hypothetical protein